MPKWINPQALIKKHKAYALVAMVLFLSACGSVFQKDSNVLVRDDAWLSDAQFFVPRAQRFDALSEWRLTAKAGIATTHAREQANAIWKYQNGTHSVRLFGPLGAGQVKFEFNPQRMVLTDNKGKRYYNQAALSRLEQANALRLPFDVLPYWLFGLPYINERPYQYHLDTEQRLSELKQLGWTVHFSRHQESEFGFLPNKITAVKGKPGTEDYVKVIVLVKKREL